MKRVYSRIREMPFYAVNPNMNEIIDDLYEITCRETDIRTNYWTYVVQMQIEEGLRR